MANRAAAQPATAVGSTAAAGKLGVAWEPARPNTAFSLSAHAHFTCPETCGLITEQVALGGYAALLATLLVSRRWSRGKPAAAIAAAAVP